MSVNTHATSLTELDAASIRARAKVLAREDYAMRSDLTRLRRDAGLTQKQVAKRMGVSQQAVQKLERYDADPKLSTIRRYANAVGALIEHSVTPDNGRAVLLAEIPPWESLSTEISAVIVNRPTGRLSQADMRWVGGSVFDFALAS